MAFSFYRHISAYIYNGKAFTAVSVMSASVHIAHLHKQLIMKHIYLYFYAETCHDHSNYDREQHKEQESQNMEEMVWMDGSNTGHSPKMQGLVSSEKLEVTADLLKILI